MTDERRQGVKDAAELVVEAHGPADAEARLKQALSHVREKYGREIAEARKEGAQV